MSPSSTNSSDPRSRTLLVLLAGLLVVGAAGGWFALSGGRSGTGATPETTTVAPTPESRTSLEPVRATDASEAAAGRSELAPTEETTRDVVDVAAAAERSTAPIGVVRGRVYDISGHTISGVGVETKNSTHDGQPLRVVTDRDGSFEIDVTDPYEHLSVVEDDWVTVRRAEVKVTSRNVEHTIIIAPRIEISGMVVNQAGVALGGARIDLLVMREAFARVSAPLDTTRQNNWSTRSTGEGRFQIDALPAVPSALLQVRLAGYETVRDPAPLQSDDTLRFVLVPASANEAGPRLEGFVRHENNGMPAAGAGVHFGRRRTIADNEGRFTLALDGVEPDATLSASLPGFEPAVRPRFGVEILGVEEPDPVTLWLPGPALEITGRLVTTEGDACAGWQMKLLDGTETDPDASPPMFAEDFAAGGSLGEAQSPQGRQQLAGRPRGSTPNLQRTGENGSFRMSGLRRGFEYVLRAWNEETLQTVDSEPIPAGTKDYLMRVPTDVFRDRVHGRALGFDGTPLENVRVRLTMRVHRTRSGTSYHTGQEVHTGSDGTYSFSNVPRVDLLVRFTGEEVESLHHELAAEDSGQGLDVRLSRRGHFRYDGPASDNAPTTLRVIDRYGEALRITRNEAGRSSSSTRFGISNGQSGVLSVSERGQWLVLERNGEEVDRRPLELRPGEVVVIR